MPTPTEEEKKPVRLSVVVSGADYERLFALKTRRRTSAQELISAWITKELEAAGAEAEPIR